MIGLYKDPEGEKVFSAQHQRNSHSINQSDTVAAGGEMELTAANNNLVNMHAQEESHWVGSYAITVPQAGKSFISALMFASPRASLMQVF